MAKRPRADAQKDDAGAQEGAEGEAKRPALGVNPRRRLGGGAYGTVYAGTLHGADVAIKVAGIDDLEDRVAAARELSILRACEHQHIVPLVGCGIVTDRETLRRTRGSHHHQHAMWMAMPRCKTTLDATRHRMDYDGIVDMLRQMTLALAYLHANGVWHRDVKANNILLTGTGAWQLCDFGLARSVPGAALDPTDDAARGGPTAACSSHVVTRWYRTPELCVGFPYDESVDTWALMCVAWECARTVASGSRSRVIFAQGGDGGTESCSRGDPPQERAEQLTKPGGMLYEIARRGVFNDAVPPHAPPLLVAAYAGAHGAHSTPPTGLLGQMNRKSGFPCAPPALKLTIAAALRAWPTQRPSAAPLHTMLCGEEAPAAVSAADALEEYAPAHASLRTVHSFTGFVDRVRALRPNRAQ